LASRTVSQGEHQEVEQQQGPAIARPTLVTWTEAPSNRRAKLSPCMLAGRLELFTVLVMFFPSFWKK
jgi:hypothetical protein